MTRLSRTLSLLPILTLSACAGLGTPVATDLDALADRLAGNDVVFLGEEHDNTAGHQLQAALLEKLHERRGDDVALSMEMFERDVQPLLDRYLAGEIEESEFLAESRPWKNYNRHYRPMVEYAKEHGLPVIAANVPRELAAKVGREGAEAVAGDPMAATPTYPRDAYWDQFQQAMAGHMGANEDTMFRFYQAQCLKDDTMAESIARHLEQAARQGDHPLVVHLCGKFHSDGSMGTVSRLEQRMPGLDIQVLSMESALRTEQRANGDLVLLVPDEPDWPQLRETAAAAAGEEAEADAGEDQQAAVDFGGRPALGFMPEYDIAVDGVMVGMVVSGGNSEAAGIQAGDVIVRLDGQEVFDVESYMQVLSSLTIGKQVEVGIERAGKPQQLKVVVGSR